MAAAERGRSLPATATTTPRSATVPTYLIEREIPGASRLTDDELRGITQKSNEVVDGLERPYTWRHSYVAGDKIYCVHEAESAGDVLEHARCGGFPANVVSEVSA